MWLMLALAAGVCLAWVRALVVVLYDRRTVPRLAGPATLPTGEAPLVSIVVPARNEELNIERCVRSLLAQSWPRFELVVVDDGSTDATPKILARLSQENSHLVVVQGTTLPAGWFGKSHACALGVARAHGTYLLFTDADSVHEPSCLAHALDTLERLQADVLTLVPRIDCVSWAEKLLQPAILGGLFTLEGFFATNRDRASMPLGNGQFLLFRRAAYQQVGGHAAVRHRVVDDLALARLVVRHQLKLRVAWAQEVLRVRMYTRFTEIWWGYAKNMAATPGLILKLEGTRLRRLAAFLVMAANSAATLAVGLIPVVAMAWSGPPRVLGVAGYLVAVLQRMLQNRDLFRIGPLWAFTLPLGHLVSAAINAHSAWRAFTGAGPRWKDRIYPWAR